MKKFGKRILALGVALGVICGISSVAFAASSLTVTINGSKATCNSTINRDEARAYTNYNGSGAVSVKSTAVSVYIPTGTIHKITRTKGNYGTASVTITKPSGDLNKRVTSNHSVSVSNQTWKGTTENKYWQG